MPPAASAVMSRWMSGMIPDLTRGSERPDGLSHRRLAFGNPRDQFGDAVLPALRVGQSELTRDRACIADVIALVAGVPVGKLDLHRPVQSRFDEAQNAF